MNYKNLQKQFSVDLVRLINFAKVEIRYLHSGRLFLYLYSEPRDFNRRSVKLHDITKEQVEYFNVNKDKIIFHILF